MSKLYFLTHTDVEIDPNKLIEKWALSEKGKERFKVINLHNWLNTIDLIFTSEEQKALDGADIVSDYLNKEYIKIKELGEFDRTSTGYQPKDVFMNNVVKFFMNPDKSVLGWEKSIDAQKRIVETISNIVTQNSDRNILIISHGGVGALYLASLLKEPISFKYNQPENGGGNYFIVNLDNKQVEKSWTPIDVVED